MDCCEISNMIVHSWMVTNTKYLFPPENSDLTKETSSSSNSSRCEPHKDNMDYGNMRMIPQECRSDRLCHLWERFKNAIKSFLQYCRSNQLDDSTMQLDSTIETLLQDWFDKLVTLHSDSARFYHTLSHLEEMFGFTDILTQLPYNNNTDTNNKLMYLNEVDKATVILAVFFHDAIYHVKSDSNEEDSANLLGDFLCQIKSACKSHMDQLQHCTNNQSQEHEWESFRIRTTSYILATKSHSNENLTLTPQLSLLLKDEQEHKRYLFCLAILLDADMAVLGKEPTAYQQYAGAIRKEYEYVPRDTYCSKRAEILESFLVSFTNKNKYVFSTIYMKDALEQKARDNLKQEIISLRNGIIPQEN